MASDSDAVVGTARTIIERDTPDDGPVTTAGITSIRELEMPPITSYTASSPCHEEQHNGVAGTSSEMLHRLTPSGFSDAIDAIGMGPFQTRMIFMCGMVSSAAFLFSSVLSSALMLTTCTSHGYSHTLPMYTHSLLPIMLHSTQPLSSSSVST